MKNNRAPPIAPAIIGMDNPLSVLLPVEVPIIGFIMHK